MPPSPSAASPLRVVTSARSLSLSTSRAVAGVLGGRVVIAGGLDPAAGSTTAVYRLDVAAGALHRVGSLAEAAHDAAGAVLGGRLYVFAGGNTSQLDSVQRVNLHGAASVVGHLPQARSDLSAVTVGSTAYVVGGFDGASPTPAVLATADGRTFRNVGALAVPVRYGAAVAVGHDIWIYGGELNGRSVDTIQRYDVTTGRDRVVGHLASPLSDAAAFAIDGHVVIAGGRLASGRITDHILVFGSDGAHVIRRARLKDREADATPVTLGGIGYLIGGEATSRLAVLQRITLTG